jgi:hypothetical protein
MAEIHTCLKVKNGLDRLMVMSNFTGEINATMML